MAQSGQTVPKYIPGYDYGASNIAQSPVSLDELRQIEQTVGWSEADAEILYRHAAFFEQNAERMVDQWRSVIGSQPHLVQWFFGPDGQKDEQYAARIKPRFIQWVIDVARRSHDQAWLNYQEEIGLRHTPAKKNVTDEKHTPPLVPLRFLLAFVPVILPIRKFFADSIRDEGEFKRLEDAWTKAVLLHVTLWSRPYAAEGFW